MQQIVVFLTLLFWSLGGLAQFPSGEEWTFDEAEYWISDPARTEEEIKEGTLILAKKYKEKNSSKKQFGL